MHIVLILIIVGLLWMLYIQSRSSGSNFSNQADLDAQLVIDSAASHEDPIVFLSQGKLFCRTPTNETRQIHSTFVQENLDKVERSKNLHGWKKGTSFDSSYTNSLKGSASNAKAMTCKSVDFINAHTLVYFLSDGNVGGLFEYDINSGIEKRLAHKQMLDLADFRFDPESNRILCSSGAEGGVRNLAAVDCENNDIVQYTEGDTIDSGPSGFPGNPRHIVMQSSGIGRGEEGYMLAIGPSSLQVLDLDSRELDSVVENDDFDYLQPIVHPNGDLYYIRRPYDKPRVSGVDLVSDVLLFPFRILRALFHYLNFFSLMYTSKPLTSASGPKVEKDRKSILVRGKHIDAEKAQREAGLVRGTPSLVPKSWQLVSRNEYGQETLLTDHVLSFDITSGGDVIYTNGFGVFKLTGNGSKLLFKDNMIETVIVH